jgi:DNA end-binding protein Ku
MAPRANWKGYLRLSLVSCPILLYPATSDAEKIRFNQINKKTGHRIKLQKVDAETGDVVEADDLIKGTRPPTVILRSRTRILTPSRLTPRALWK